MNYGLLAVGIMVVTCGPIVWYFRDDFLLMYYWVRKEWQERQERKDMERHRVDE